MYKQVLAGLALSCSASVLDKNRKMKAIDHEAGIKQAFKTYDRDDRDFINLEELRHALTNANLGQRASDDEVNTIILECEKYLNEDGQVWIQLTKKHFHYK